MPAFSGIFHWNLPAGHYLSHPCLQVTKSCLKAWMIWNFSLIGPLTMELAALQHLKKSMSFSRLILIQSFFKIAGNKDIHNILDEFELRPGQTTDSKLAVLKHLKNIPLTYLYNGENNVDSIFCRLFLNQFFSGLQVIRTLIKA